MKTPPWAFAGRMLDRLCLLVATALYLSYIPYGLSRLVRLSRPRWTGSGFVGTLAGWALLYALPENGARFSAALLCGLALAILVSARAERIYGVHDDARIVVDEIVGYWSAVAYLPRDRGVLLAGFVLFRIFDAFKPPPACWLERLPGGYGVVMDDVGAGAAANVALRLGLWAARLCR